MRLVKQTKVSRSNAARVLCGTLFTRSPHICILIVHFAFNDTIVYLKKKHAIELNFLKANEKQHEENLNCEQFKHF